MFVSVDLEVVVELDGVVGLLLVGFSFPGVSSRSSDGFCRAGFVFLTDGVVELAWWEGRCFQKQANVYELNLA
jgi:hypothetical protein